MPLCAGKHAICAFLWNMRNMLWSHVRYKPVSLPMMPDCAIVLYWSSALALAKIRPFYKSGCYPAPAKIWVGFEILPDLENCHWIIQILKSLCSVLDPPLWISGMSDDVFVSGLRGLAAAAAGVLYGCCCYVLLGKRPFGVSILYIGWDKHHGFQLYQSDPSGNYGGWKATCIGNNSAVSCTLF